MDSDSPTPGVKPSLLVNLENAYTTSFIKESGQQNKALRQSLKLDI